MPNWGRYVASCALCLIKIFIDVHLASNQVLKVVVDLVATQFETSNKQPALNKELSIHFHKKGESPLWETKKKNNNTRVLIEATNRRMPVDLTPSPHFPVHFLQTNQRPHIMVWSDSEKSVLLVELTVSWEENTKEKYERKVNRYETLRAKLRGVEYFTYNQLRSDSVIFLDF